MNADRPDNLSGTGTDERRGGPHESSASAFQNPAAGTETPGAVAEELLRAIADIESRIAKLRTAQHESARQEAALARREETLADRERELRARLDEVEAASRGAQEWRAQLETQSRELSDRREELDRDGADLANAASAADHELRAQRQAFERALQEQRFEGERGLAELTARVQEATAARLSAEARAARLDEELERARSASSARQGPADAPDLEAAFAKRDHAIKVLAERLKESEGARSELEERLGAAPATPPPPSVPRAPADRNHSRRARLARYKSLLQAQTRKIVQAKAALQQRQAECEHVLAQRAKLAGAVNALRQREKHIASQRAKAGAAAMAFYVLASTGILAALSWAIADRVAPATYIARAVIEADGAGRTMSGGELGAWQGFHENLIADPMLMELGAERMTKRGLATLGTPAELGAHLSDSLYTQSQDPGSLTLELRGIGAERTERILDTFVTAMVSAANTARAQRPDAAATAVAQAAEAGDDPIKDSRTAYAAGILGGGMTGTLALAVLVWRGLARAKQRFESQERIEEALAEGVWGGVEAGPRSGRPA